ncbi:hypothetical protein FACS189411_09160 [Bacteroidia bacterium]|nr:hypothetical protein FACS189411_09160 [Bacteroidia bacterium]
MKKSKLIQALSLALLFPLFSQAQEYNPFSHVTVGLSASTLGVGLEAATPLSKNFNARAGIDYVGFNAGYVNFDLDDNSSALYDAIGYVPNYRAKIGFDQFHGHLLADFYPMTNGVFHLTAGVYLGSSKINVDGFLADQNDQPATLKPGFEWPSINLDGYDVPLTNGRANVGFLLRNAVKPYIGLGLGKFVTKHRLGFKFDFGAFYQGDYSVKQNGKKINLDDTELNNFEDIDQYTKWLKWWPVINFQLTYRIF